MRPSASSLILVTLLVGPSAVAAPKGKARPRKAPAPSADAAPADPPQPLFCPVPFEVPARADLALRCAVKAALKADSVTVHYRPAGGEVFTPVSLDRGGDGWYTGVIPGSALEGKLLQYYVVANGRDGSEVASNGKSDTPNVLLVKGGAALSPPKVAGPDVPGAPEEKAPVEVSGATTAPAANPNASPRRPGGIWVGWSAGTGFGFHSAGALESQPLFEAGSAFAWGTLGHFAPEVGYQVNDRLGVSLQSRHQIIPRQDTDPTRPGAAKRWAHSVLARATYLYDLGRFQAYAAGMAGFGQGFRFRIDPLPSKGLFSSDTVRGGPGIVGAGGGAIIPFANRLAVVAEANWLFGLGDFATMLDFNLGVQLGF